MRIIFRICEYSQGFHSSLPNHEAYQYCLDSLPMLVALVVLNVVHPGRLMPGSDSNLPSRKQRKDGIRTRSNLDSVSRSDETKVNVLSSDMSAA